jgi:hypothetical protein
MATQHFAAAQDIEWLLRIGNQIILAFRAGTQRSAKKTRVNEMFNKTYDVTLRRILATAVAVQKAFSITYSECMFVDFFIQCVIAHAPYCHLCPAQLYNIFPHYLINGMIFEKRKLLNELFLITSATIA